jgi:hypothetical protein
LNNKLQEENVQLKKNQDLMFNEITKLKETVNKETLTI